MVRVDSHEVFLEEGDGLVVVDTVTPCKVFD